MCLGYFCWNEDKLINEDDLNNEDDRRDEDLKKEDGSRLIFSMGSFPSKGFTYSLGILSFAVFVCKNYQKCNGVF